MILDSHLDFLRDKFIRKSWSNPSLETNISINPTLLNVKYPSYASIRFMRSNILLPDNETGYDVYSLEYVPSIVFRQHMHTVGKWVSLVDFCTTNNLLMYLSYADVALTALYSKTFIQYLPNRTVILAVPTVSRTLRGNLNVYIRTSNDSLETDIDVTETHVDSTLKLNTWLANYIADTNKTFNQYHINGVYADTVTSSTLKVGDYVSTITDTSTDTIKDILLSDLGVYDKVGNLHYLVPVSDKQDTGIYSRFDSLMYLVRGNVGKRIIMDKNSIVQVTDNELGLDVTLVEALLSDLGWVEGEVTLRIYTKVSMPRQTYMNNDNYWYSLQQLPQALRQQALLGTFEAPEFIYAKNYHENVFNLALDLEFEDITVDALSDSIMVSTWDYYVNRTLVSNDTYNNNLTDLLPVDNVSKVLCSFTGGFVDTLRPTENLPDNSHLLIGYAKETTVTNSNTIDISDFMIPIAYVKNLAEFTRLEPGEDYSIIGGNLVAKIGFRDVYGLDLATTYTETLSGDRHVYDMPLSPALFGLGHIILLGDDKVLTPNIDYTCHDSTLIVNYAKDVERLEFIFQPTINPTNTIVETGFTRNGTISIDNNYLELDPHNHYIVVGGQMVLPEELEWDIPYTLSDEVFANGLPYAVVKVLLSNCNGDLDTVDARRKVYADNLLALAAFKDINIPKVTVDDSFYSESYRLVSVFMNAVYLAGLNGEILTDRNSVNSIGLPNLLADYLHLLEDGYDVFTQDLEHNVIDLRAHRFDEPLPVSSNLYYLIELVNDTYLGGRVLVNTNFRITT